MSVQLSVTDCYLPGSEKPCSSEADDDVPPAVLYSLSNICFTFLLFTNVWSWPYACTRVSLLLPFLCFLQIALLVGRTRPFLSWIGLSIEENAERYQMWPLVCVFGCTWDTGQRNGLESSHFVDTALNSSLSSGTSYAWPPWAASDVTPEHWAPGLPSPAPQPPHIPLPSLLIGKIGEGGLVKLEILK